MRPLSRFLPLVLAACAFGSTPASAGNKVLVIGDSHLVGEFGKGLLATLRQNNIPVSLHGSCGSSPQQWIDGGWMSPKCSYSYDYGQKESEKAPTFKLEETVRRDKPDVVVMALGTNQLWGTAENAKKTVLALMKAARVGGGNCAWVGPPRVGFFSKAKDAERRELENSQQVAKYYGMLKDASREMKCLVIDSRPFTDPKESSDKIHYGGKAGTHWGTQVGGRILQFLHEVNGGSSATAESRGTGYEKFHAN
jgi:hypothetical protein